MHAAASQRPLIGSWRTFRLSRDGRVQSQCQVMTNLTELAPVAPGRPAPLTDQLRLAVAAYLARFKGLLPRAHRIRPSLPPDLVC